MAFSTEELKITQYSHRKKNLKRTRCSKYYWIFYSWWWQRQNQDFVWVCSVHIPTEDLCAVLSAGEMAANKTKPVQSRERCTGIIEANKKIKQGKRIENTALFYKGWWGKSLLIETSEWKLKGREDAGDGNIQEKSIPGKEKSNFKNTQVEPCLEHVSSEEATVCTGKWVEEMS